MKLVRYSNGSETRLGVVLGNRVVDIANLLKVSGCGTFTEGSMRSFLSLGSQALESLRDALRTTDSRSPKSIPLDEVKLLAPIHDPQKIVCVGQNYRDHCEEQNQPLPERAILFAKFPSAIIGPGDSIVLPRISNQVDYEAELAFIVGTRARNVPEIDALNHIAGYMCLNDVSARDIQFGDKQWVRGKTLDTFAPCGPWITTADEIPDPHNLAIKLTPNGNIMQNSNTTNLVFDVAQLVSYISEAITLEPGDIVTTGTPGGVGVFRTPQVFLKPGDIVSVTISSIGTLSNTVVAE